MTYGISSMDLGKAAVLFSCLFPAVMFALVAQDPKAVIHSENGAGWWDVLQGIDDPRVGVYPRIWATMLLMQLVVRLNWVFTNETAPALYRCVLMSYIIPFNQYFFEIYIFRTLPPLDWATAFVILVGPWFALILGYSKYTQEPTAGGTGAAAAPPAKKGK